MSIKRTVVYCGNPSHLQSTAPVAREIAFAMDSSVTGLFVDVRDISERRILSRIPEDAVEQHLEALRQERLEMKASFNEAFEDPRIDSRWVESRGEPDEELLKQMLYHDLLVMSQKHPDEHDLYASKIHQSLLYGSAPVVVCPVEPSSRELGRHIVIAWNGSRHCARAVRSAMAMLLVAESVSTIVLHKKEDTELASLECDRLTSYLASHRVRVHAQRIVVANEPHAEDLLNVFAKQNASMAVMGAWGHSRLRELVLGGFTREVLSKATIPVWMNH